jgi:2-polyprenyl-6-methoxyphenol hydroxylase-like FAD-dependent oxidoreductase
MQPQSIAVIGAGTAGLATAALLAEQHHGVTLFERAEALAPVGAGLLLQPTGLSVLKAMGLYHRMMAYGARVDALVGDNHRGLRIMHTAYQTLHRDLHGLGVHRASLCAVLDEHLHTFPHQRVMGCEVSAVESRDDHARVSVTQNGETTSRTFDAVLIANGSHSQLRPAAWTRYDKLYPWGAMWTMLPMHDPFQVPLLQQRYRHAHEMVGILPTGCRPDQPAQPLLSFFWSLPVSEMASWRAPTFDFPRWQQQVFSLWPALEDGLASLQSTKQMLPAIYRDVIMDRWGEGRLGVIGDAAHAMSPQLGQGANMALLDAHGLGRAVAASQTWEQVWQHYHRHRGPQIRFYQRMSRWLTPSFQSHSRVVAAGRDVVLPLLHGLPWFRSQVVKTVAGLKSGLFSDHSSL